MDTYGGRTYEYRAPRDWDDPSGRVVSQRRGSDTEYDVRTPRQHHPDARPKPSYYGRDFQSVEQGISSSYTGPRHPFENPSVWEKRPDPYTSTVKKDYEYYKYDRVPARNVASTSYSSAKRAGRQPPQTNSDYHAKLRDLSSEVMLRANEECQARSGFDLKYPYAYEDHEAKLRHQKEAFNSRGFNGRSKQELHQEQVDLYDILASGRKPTGQSKKKSKR